MVAETLPEPRRHTEVAVGVLLRTDGALLFTTRPPAFTSSVQLAV